jgi:ubiquitin carboxyl-terminal hydrolase 36/42
VSGFRGRFFVRRLASELTLSLTDTRRLCRGAQWTLPTRAGAGLRNCGNTCFLNAVLQALTHCPPLAAIATRRLHSRHCAARPCALCVLEQRIHASLCAPAPPGAQAPTEVLSAMQHFAPRLARGRQEDAHEMLRLMVEALQHACLRSAGLPTHGPLTAPSKRERTMVERIFGGELRSAVVCRSCGAASHTADPFDDLSLELHGGVASVRDALAAFTRAETLDADNKYRCEACKALSTADKRISIARVRESGVVVQAVWRRA